MVCLKRLTLQSQLEVFTDNQHFTLMKLKKKIASYGDSSFCVGESLLFGSIFDFIWSRL